MSNHPKVSVIIPVYNVEPYVHTCIQSLQAQTLKDMEFIFIDDCGPDDSFALIERAAQDDPRIKLLKNPENMGAGRSRNRGIDAATGDFIGFLDPDDWIDKNFYEVLYNRAVDRGHDIVKARRVKVIQLPDGCMWEKESNVNENVKRLLKRKKSLYRCFTSEHQTGIFSRQLIQDNHIYNGTSSHSENSVFLLGACYLSKSFTIDGDVAYYYLQREDSSVHTFDERKFTGEALSFEEQIDFAVDKAMWEDPCFVEWLRNKVRFLLRRYNELHGIKELAYLRTPFLRQIHGALAKLPKQTLKELNDNERKIRLLISGDLNGLMLIYDHPKLYGRLKKTRDKVRKARLSFGKKSMTAADAIAAHGYTEGELAYLQNHRGSIVYSKRLFDLYPDFALPYVKGFVNGLDSHNCTLDPEGELFAEHHELLQSNELCWRYVKRFGSISKSTVYLSDEGELRLKGEILGSQDVIDAADFIVHPQEERPIFDGILLKDFLGTLEKRGDCISELKTYLKFLFNEYSADDDHMLGIAYDAFPFNCMLGEGHTYELFDLEFEYKVPFDKGYMIYKVCSVLGNRRKYPVYLELCDYFGIAPGWRHWDDFNFRNWIDTISHPDDKPSSKENKELFKRYYLA